jgi:hypothetical protein
MRRGKRAKEQPQCESCWGYPVGPLHKTKTDKGKTRRICDYCYCTHLGTMTEYPEIQSPDVLKVLKETAMMLHILELRLKKGRTR